MGEIQFLQKIIKEEEWEDIAQVYVAQVYVAQIVFVTFTGLGSNQLV